MAVMADGCNNLIEDFLCFVLKQIYACKMYTRARLPHEGRIYFLLYYHSVSSSATTVTPFVLSKKDLYPAKGTLNMASRKVSHMYFLINIPV